MCGIAGMVRCPPRIVERHLVETMTETLRHRGPDAAGFFFQDNIGLGHRRLTIIDTSKSANQPMVNEDGSVVVVYNGEIYNFRQLAEDLKALGHRFRTRCDTEVILHAWEEYGHRCVEHFRGMFAFAIYDANRRQLFLARDRLGKKPLYYSSSPGCLVFASEIKALRQIPQISADLDLQALGEYATYGHSLGGRTIYRNIRQLPPAHTMQVSSCGEILVPRIDCYWQVEPDPDETIDVEEWLDRLDATLSEAVRLRLVSDVPLGAFLSGGIDSSLVVAYMAKHSPGRVETFTMGSPEASHDESDWAQAVAEHLGTNHHMQLVTPDAVGALENLVDTYDEPFADESAIPTYHLAKLTREHVKVALSGDGGDECFLGYPRYFRSLVLERAGHFLPGASRRLLGAVSERLPYSSRLRLPLQRLSRTGFALYNHALGYSNELLELLHPDVRRQLVPANKGKIAHDYNSCENSETLARYAYVDLKNYLPDDILVKVDRASMHHSLEVRCPLLDHHLVELAARIPSRFKQKGATGKWILRRLLRRHLPAALVDRPKRGFGVPLSAWFRQEFAPMLENMMADRQSPAWQYFNHAAVAQRLALHRSSRADLYGGLWQLPTGLWRALFFYYWSRKNLS